MRRAYCDRLPATYGGKARFNVMNAMAAAGRRLARVRTRDIRAGLTGFLPTWDSAPGRSTTSTSMGSTASWTTHNAPGLRALGGIPARRILKVCPRAIRTSDDDASSASWNCWGPPRQRPHRVGPGRRGVLRRHRHPRGQEATWTRAEGSRTHRSGDQRAEPRTNPGNAHHPRRGRGHRVCRVSGQPRRRAGGDG